MCILQVLYVQFKTTNGTERRRNERVRNQFMKNAPPLCGFTFKQYADTKCTTLPFQQVFDESGFSLSAGNHTIVTIDMAHAQKSTSVPEATKLAFLSANGHLHMGTTSRVRHNFVLLLLS